MLHKVVLSGREGHLMDRSRDPGGNVRSIAKERNGNIMVKWEFRRKEWEPQCENMGVCSIMLEHLVGKGA